MPPFHQFSRFPPEVQLMIATEAVTLKDPAPIELNVRRVPFYQDRMMRSYYDIPGPAAEARFIARLENDEEFMKKFENYARSYPKYLPKTTTNERFFKISFPKSRHPDFDEGLDWVTQLKGYCEQRTKQRAILSNGGLGLPEYDNPRGPLAFAYTSKMFFAHCMRQFVANNQFQLRWKAQHELLYASGRFLRAFYPRIAEIQSLRIHVSAVPDRFAPARIKPWQKDGTHDLVAYAKSFPKLKFLSIHVEWEVYLLNMWPRTQDKMVRVLTELLHTTPFGGTGCYDETATGPDGEQLNSGRANLLLLFEHLTDVRFELGSTGKLLLPELAKQGGNWKREVEDVIRPAMDGLKAHRKRMAEEADMEWVQEAFGNLFQGVEEYKE